MKLAPGHLYLILYGESGGGGGGGGEGGGRGIFIPRLIFTAFKKNTQKTHKQNKQTNCGSFVSLQYFLECCCNIRHVRYIINMS